jgi:transcriptional regulator with XRE-family HTH domain
MSSVNKTVTTFGEQLRAIRESAQLSLRDVSSEIGIDTSLLGKIERNERFPTKDQIQLIAKFFKLDERQLIKEVLSDQFAYKIIEEKADLDTLRTAEDKIRYLIKQKG